MIKRLLISLALFPPLSTPATAQVQIAAIVPAVGRTVQGDGERVLIRTGPYVFYGIATYVYIRGHRAFLQYDGWQDGVPSFALIEAEDGDALGKVDRLYVVVLLNIGEGDFGLPGRGSFAYPLFTNGDAVTVIGGGK